VKKKEMMISTWPDILLLVEDVTDKI